MTRRMMLSMTRPLVLVFCGTDPSGGAGITADIQALTACGVHPLPVVTSVTVQDNARVFALHPMAAEVVWAQAEALIKSMPIAAVKIGILGSHANALAIARVITRLRERDPALPVVLDPVLASGEGDALSTDDPVQAMQVLLPLASLVTPNLPEAARLCALTPSLVTQTPADLAALLLARGCRQVLIKGGHGLDPHSVTNHWFSPTVTTTWHWPRLAASFHGSGCTLASAIAAFLARGIDMEQALELAQRYCQATLTAAFAIAPGQRIPDRCIPDLSIPDLNSLPTEFA